MSLRIRYRCRNCGTCFDATVLSPEEVRDAQRRGESLGQVHCIQCYRTDVDRER